MAWALTDHDTVAGQLPAAQAARRLNVRFVPGIELSALLDEREVHVLGHFIDPVPSGTERFRGPAGRPPPGRDRKIVGLLAENGVSVTEEAIVACSGGKTIGRPHVARALVEAGAVSRSGRPSTAGSGRAALPTWGASGSRWRMPWR